MRARFGRAKNLGERSIGPRDAGASSMACIFAAFAERWAETFEVVEFYRARRVPRQPRQSQQPRQLERKQKWQT
jgi:hypothetical protein